jgi:glucose/arabinose dehydrogenase
MFRHLWLSISLLLVSVGCGDGTTQTPPPGPSPTLALVSLVGGLNSPVDLQRPNDNTGRLFVVEQSGMIRIIASGSLLSGSFLDIAAKITTGSEMGLLGLAFHPSYSQNRRFFVNYNRSIGGQLQTVIAEYLASTSDANQADPASERILLIVNQPFGNHKGGQLAFGPDGFLYIGLGDGGSGGDPFGNGQSLQTMLGKMLRIDVDNTDPGLQYAIPADNPFAAGGGRPEIWAYGLRNPWRFSFESGTGRLFCADVGQDSFEEVDLLQKGGNFGWNTMEGMHCFNPSSGCNQTGLILPIAEYSHSEGEAVIGGYVYHGAAIPSLAGTYILGDYVSGAIWGLKEGPPGTWTRSLLLSTQRNISSFGQDAAGEVYVVDYSGNVLKLVAQ